MVVLGAAADPTTVHEPRRPGAPAMNGIDAAAQLGNAAVRVRTPHVAKRPDGAPGKSCPVLLAGVAVVPVALAAPSLWVSHRAPTSRPALLRRRYSLLLRGPPRPSLV
jgi:hypothetical protein